MTDPKRLLMVDDHAIVRAGYRHLLQRQPRFQVVGEADEVQQAYLLYRQLLPDVLLTDLSLPGAGGIELIRRVRAIDPRACIVVFSMHVSPEHAREAMNAGARAYVTKSSPPDVLLRAIDCACHGQPMLSPDIAQLLALAQLGADRPPLEALNPREFEVLRLLVAPQSVAQIAETLHLSPKTVNNLHYQIKRKLGVASDIELTRLALRCGLG